MAARTHATQTNDGNLATRIPEELRRRLKLYCVTHDVTVADFVVAAIRERLARERRPNGNATRRT